MRLEQPHLKTREPLCLSSLRAVMTSRRRGLWSLIPVAWLSGRLSLWRGYHTLLLCCQACCRDRVFSLPTKCATRLLKSLSQLDERKSCRTRYGAWKRWQKPRDGGQKVGRMEEQSGKEAIRLHSEKPACPRRGNRTTVKTVLSRYQTE
jgi:hypothetical protein